MRKPTSIDDQLTDWRRMVETGARPTDEEPCCGWFKTRAARGSKTWLPARVWLNQEIDWKTGDLMAPETYVLDLAGRRITDQMTISERSLFLRAVTVDEWRWLTARLALHSIGTGRPAYMYG